MRALVLLLLVCLGAAADESEYKVCDGLHKGTPPDNKDDTVPSKEDYAAALKNLDMDKVKADMKALLTDSKDCWPADFGHYGPFFIRLAWHCSGSFRATDGKGGCGGGRQRYEPERSWPDNTNLDKARALLAPLKEQYGDALSWGDLFILAGTTALRDMGTPIKRMCFGRVDEPNGDSSKLLGPTALQVDKMPCEVNGKCKAPLGATTVGLVYVNPEGPMANPDPEGSAANIRDSFGRMGHDSRATVALIGAHAFGKGHGACDKENGAGLLPKDAYEKDEVPWKGTCGTGKGSDTVTAGFEGAWTSNPTKFDNEYYKVLFDHKDVWEKHKGPGGHWQWRIKDGEAKDDKFKDVMRLTSDIALLHDDEYIKIVKEFADDQDAFAAAFNDAWYNLTTYFGSGTWSEEAKCDDVDEFPDELRNVKIPEIAQLNTDMVIKNIDATPGMPKSVLPFVAMAGMLTMVVALFGIHRLVNGRTTSSHLAPLVHADGEVSATEAADA